MPITLPPLSRRQWLKNAAATAIGTLTPAWAARAAVPASGSAESWVLFSDTHIAADPAAVSRETCMAENLTRCVNQVLKLGQKPYGVLVNGDCAHLQGLEGDYATFGKLVEPLREAGVPVNCTLGNHDDRDQFWTAFAVADEIRPVAAKHVKVLPSATMNWVLLDSLQTVNQTPGTLGETQLAWLDRALRDCSDRPTVVMAHHNPQGPVVEGKKATGLLDSDAMFQVLAAHGKVKAFIYGHTHNWAHEKHEGTGLHLINLPPVAYTFGRDRPNGWVIARAKAEGLELELRALNPAHDEHGSKVQILWA